MVFNYIVQDWTRTVKKCSEKTEGHPQASSRLIAYTVYSYAPRYAARTASLVSSSSPLPVSVMRPVSST